MSLVHGTEETAMSDQPTDPPGAPPGPPRYPGTAPPPYPGGGGAPPPGPDPWYTPPGQPGGYSPPGSPPGWSPSPQGFDSYAGGAPYAGYWSRVGGAVIDSILIWLASLIFLLPTHALRGMHDTNGTTHHFRFAISTGGVLVLLVIGALYAGFMIGLRGQTLGMMALRIKAVDATTGGLIGFPRALGRDLFERLLGVLFVIPLIVDLLFPVWDPRRQTLHDKVVNSVVIRA